MFRYLSVVIMVPSVISLYSKCFVGDSGVVYGCLRGCLGCPKATGTRGHQGGTMDYQKGALDSRIWGLHEYWCDFVTLPVDSLQFMRLYFTFACMVIVYRVIMCWWDIFMVFWGCTGAVTTSVGGCVTFQGYVCQFF